MSKPGIFGHGLGARRGVKFFVRPADVGVYGRNCNVQPVSNFFVEVALSNQLEHLLFARRKGFPFCDGRGTLAEKLNDLPSNVAADGRAALMNLLQRREQFPARSLL